MQCGVSLKQQKAGNLDSASVFHYLTFSLGSRSLHASKPPSSVLRREMVTYNYS